MQQIHKIAQPFPEILVNCYFGGCCTCPDMPNQTQQILHDLTEVSMDIWLHAKNEHYSLNSFWDIKIQKILQSNWWRAFWPVTWEQDFP